MKKIIATDRLYLRELTPADSVELSKILKDQESMRYYPRPYTDAEVENWLRRHINSYIMYHHGLWAVIRKEDDVFIGDCGISMQQIEGKMLPEVGYRINKAFWNMGYATEAAKACLKYAFNKLNYNKVYSYTDKANIPSRKVAEKIGMKFLREFSKLVMNTEVIEVLFSVDKNDFYKSIIC